MLSPEVILVERQRSDRDLPLTEKEGKSFGRGHRKVDARVLPRSRAHCLDFSCQGFRKIESVPPANHRPGARPGGKPRVKKDACGRRPAPDVGPHVGRHIMGDDFSAGVRALDRLTKTRTIDDKTVKGINFFDPGDNALLQALQNPRVNIAGIRRADLLALLDQLSPHRLSRQLRRLRDIGVIKRVTGTYRYYLTRIGRAAIAALCRVTQTIIVPALA